ncbi:N,N-dimethylformamidase beta subunit family domain-containing protein [Rubellimicrobium arenae]|uniref:N,N-dimethylformamidase beta subunit family domain-containing protein n=1 Tax=Rubellimicrobium arenae TaxID=2817372 RepID=UPI001B30658C|nr:N,N-dimethylformamidase beta subunit family domain-containing protein [Rubellimicrobium arenae]
MKRMVDHRALAVAGFVSPWSVRAGQEVALHLSCPDPVDRVRAVRIDTPEAVPVPWPVRPVASPAPQAFDRGSRLVVAAEDIARIGPVEGVAVEVLLTRNPSRRTLLRAGPVRVEVEGERLLFLLDGHGTVGDLAVPAQRWMALRIESRGGGTALACQGGDALSPLDWRLDRPDLAWPDLPGPLMLGWGGDEREPSANARFARPELRLGGRRIAWRFPARLPGTPVLLSDGPEALEMAVVNLPTFCLRSPRWDGSSFEPRLVPDHYDAIHCHDTDMGAVDWPATHLVAVPPEAGPGIYAIEVAAGAQVERIPFFVRGRTPDAPVVFLVPTATYLAYANEFLPQHLFPWVGTDRAHEFAQDNDLRSLYDHHSDLSGVSITSCLKPMPTLREDYSYPLCGCGHNLPVDLRLLRFCHAQGIAFDLVTDHDLHHEGVEALRPYRAVLTGSHPEYMSVEMEDALRGFAAGGGTLLYLGGNGFAATVAFHGDLMELRRGPMEAGRTWDGPVAEQALAITNEPGGFLRNRGRGEFSLIGGAISLMGFDGARPFRRTGGSRDPSCAWVFEGVPGEVFGETGTVLGGAAGYEVDATDPHLGTHPDTVVLARAEAFPPGYVPDPTRWYPGGEPEAQARRGAEMTLRHLPGGGMVFSASSVAWCGALPSPGEMNDVGRITLNLLARATATGGTGTPPQQANQEGDHR